MASSRKSRERDTANDLATGLGRFESPRLVLEREGASIRSARHFWSSCGITS